MEKEQLISKEDSEAIRQYIDHLRYYKDSSLCSAIVYFLSQEKITALNEQRKLFILKVLRECTHSCKIHIDLFPMEVEKKLILAYKAEKQKEQDEKQAHIAELLEEMNGLF